MSKEYGKLGRNSIKNFLFLENLKILDMSKENQNVVENYNYQKWELKVSPGGLGPGEGPQHTPVWA